MSINNENKIILISDPVIQSVDIKENGEALFDLSKQNIIPFGKPPRSENSSEYTKVRKTVYRKLLLAQSLLPTGLKLCLYEGYRNTAIQHHLFTDRCNYLAGIAKYKNFSKESIFIEATKLVSPVYNIDGSKNIAPHSTGAAIEQAVASTVASASGDASTDATASVAANVSVSASTMPITKRLYYFDAYKTSHKATVTSLNSELNSVQLDETIFHPHGGGQPSDVGTIEGISVEKVSAAPSGEIHHFLAKRPTFRVGDAVNLEVDPDARLLFTRLHSAGHLIAHIAEKNHPGLKAVQGHHFPNEARVEFTYNDVPDLEDFKTKISAGLKEATASKTMVFSKFDEKTGRTITMGDFTPTPCGGTHVNKLSEIGEVKIRSLKNKGGRLRLGYDV